MPHLQFEFNFTPERAQKVAFADAVRKHFATIMSTGTDHIGITYRCYQQDDLVFGRAGDGPIAFLNPEMRLGRTAGSCPRGRPGRTRSTTSPLSRCRSVLSCRLAKYGRPDDN